LDFANDDIETEAIADLKACHAVLLGLYSRCATCKSTLDLFNAILSIENKPTILQQINGTIHNVAVLNKLFDKIDVDTGLSAAKELEHIMSGSQYILSNVDGVSRDNSTIKLKVAGEEYDLNRLEELRNKLVSASFE
jgi:hypothetical protein